MEHTKILYTTLKLNYTLKLQFSQERMHRLDNLKMIGNHSVTNLVDLGGLTRTADTLTICETTKKGRRVGGTYWLNICMLEVRIASADSDNDIDHNCQGILRVI